MKLFEHKYALIALLAMAALLFIPGLGIVHLFDWDEINFTEMAREMIVTNDWMNLQMNFESFYEKPPLFIWLQAISMKLVGIGEFGARLPNALIGITTVFFLFQMGKKIHNQSLAVWWVLCYICSLLPHFYFKSALIDPTFNLFIFMGICFAFISLTEQDSKLRNVLLSGICIALATMTKGPVALLIFGLTALVYIVSQRQYRGISFAQVFVFLLSFVAIVSCWYLIHYFMYGPSFIKHFYARQVALLSSHDAGHSGFLGYHPLVLLLGCAPASIYLFFYPFKNKIPSFDRLMWLLLIIIIVLFELVQTKIIHYSSMAYFPITFLAARSIYALSQRLTSKRFIAVFILGLIWIFAAFLVAFIGDNPSLITDYVEIKDPFALANLNADVEWSWLSKYFCVLPLSILLMASFYPALSTAKRLVLQLLAFLVFIQGFMYLSLSNIEQHTQSAVIEFVESLEPRDAPIFVYGQKSYIHHFYGQQKPVEDFKNGLKQIRENKLSRAYFIVKTHKAKGLEKELKGIHKLSDKNGYSFFLYNETKTK